MKTMKKIGMMLMAAIVAFGMTACNESDNPVEPVEDGPTAKEKAMVPSMMMWQLDSMQIIYYPGSLIETSQMLYAGIDTYQWTYTFYPCTEKLPDGIVFRSDFEDYSINVSEEYTKDYCKYVCTESGEVISAGYLCYYKDYFTFSGLQQGCWVEFKLREASTNWNTVVWTTTYDSSVALDGTVEERTIEYYSRVRETAERGGSASVTVNGTTFSVNNAYWDVAVANGSDAFYTLQFYNFNKLGDADPMDIVTIVYKVSGGSQTELATGEFADFEVSLTRMGSNEAQDRQYYTFSSDNTGAKLKVAKSGAGYQVQFGAMKYTVDGSAGATTYNGTAFNFTGGFKKGTLLQ